MSKTSKVAIIGAGIAGLNAARHLKMAGVSAAIFEGSGRVGGRMWTDRDSAGAPFERGAEFINENHAEMRAIAEELEIELYRLYSSDDQKAPIIAHQVGQATYSERDLAVAIQPLSDRARQDAHSTKIGQMSVKEYLDRVSLDSWARDIVELYVTAEYGLNIDRVSASMMLEFARMDPEHPSITCHGYARYCVKYGSEAITQAVAGQLEDQIQLDHCIESIRETGGRYHLKFERSAREYVAEHLIIAIPFSTLRRVELKSLNLSPLKMRAINELPMGTNAKIVVGYSPRVRAKSPLSEVFSREAQGFVWESGRSTEHTSGSLVVYRGGVAGAAVNQTSAEAETDSLVAALDAAFPGSAARFTGEIAGVNWSDNLFSLGSYACLGPGQFAEFGSALSEQDGRIAFAGEHTSRLFQGFMNGAAESGRRAAEHILRIMETA